MSDVFIDVAGLIKIPDEDHAVVGGSGYLFAEWVVSYHWGWKATELI